MDTPYAEGEEARKLLEVAASGDLAEVARNQACSRKRVSASRPHSSGAIAAHARERAQLLERGSCTRAQPLASNVPRVYG